MAGLSSLLRESGRSSKPHDPNAKSFLTLPAELRNRIYDLLFESKERMRVIFSKTHKSEDEITGTHFRSKTGSAVALFSTYKKILKEAAPVLYTRNTFILSQEKAPMLRIGSHKKVGAVGPFQTWISTIGSNAQLLRHVTLDVYATCYDENYFYPRWSGQIDETGVLDVLGILQVLWSADLTLEMSFIVATCLSDSSWDRSYNVAAMTRNFHALRDDQLNLRRYLPLLDAVHLNLNGSGGLILWYTSANHASEDKYPQIWHEPTYTSKIVSGDDDANRLSIIERKSPMTLMGLPHYLLTKIWSDVILPPEGITVDLDTETHFKNEATYTNRRLYKEWRGLFLNLNPLTAKMTTSTVRSDFSNFTKLRQLLRTAFSSTNSTYTDSTLQLQAGFEMILDFRLGQLAALEDLRVSVLILVLESCHVPANSTIRIRLWRLDSVYVTDQVVIGLEQLRRKVVAALEEFVKSDTHKAAPEIWINADGQVVEVVEKPAPNREDPLMPMPEMASQVVRSGNGLYQLLDAHPRDFRAWRDNRTANHIGCGFENCDQFFPFHHSATETLRYIATTLNEPSENSLRRRPPMICVCGIRYCEYKRYSTYELGAQV